ncbi:MAG TPA: hypothetical protein VJN18_00720 [Polyangiaceae bacterium]|nr:hypothetical protein [Polyangiaceae bacterium]
MLLTAQRVRNLAGLEGINAFCNLHGSYEWFGEPPTGIPDINPGTRVNDSVVVPPGGNRVRSYLDIVAPDETPTAEVIAAVRRFVLAVRADSLPWAATVGRCTFRFGLDLGLEQQWAAEFQQLLEAALRVRSPV